MQNSLSCHLVGFNPYTKNEFINKINNKTFNIIDLDNINRDILQNDSLDKMYKQYQKLKNDKNDKYKEVDKKMSQFWMTNFIDTIHSKINNKKTNILIGQNNHYKSLTKRVNIECTNKFIIKGNNDEEVKSWIKYNLETYKDDIINGEFPLEYINYDFLSKKRTAIETTYKKIGYIEKSIDELNTMFDLIEKSSKKDNKIYVSLKEPYNVGSLIHPNNDNKILGFNNPETALISSIKLKNNDVTLKDIKQNEMKKLKTRRFLYLVEPQTFIPHENNKFFSQIPVKIINKERIDNVHSYLFDK
jgi:hypothetical protein